MMCSWLILSHRRLAASSDSYVHDAGWAKSSALTFTWGLPKMNDRCLVCGLHFNREAGYFLGAMYISYGLGLAFVVGFGAILWWITHWRVDKIAIWAVLLFLPFAPMLTFLSRVLWIYLDQTMDPEK